MFEPPATYQVGLTFYYRGPEWAIAVRQGDMKALTWAFERCSQFWNGASTLIIPVRSDGRTWPVISDYLDDRPVENSGRGQLRPLGAQLACDGPGFPGRGSGP